RIERVRFANGEPTQYEIAYIPWDVEPGITKNHAETSLYESLENDFEIKITQTTEKVEIILADEKLQEYIYVEKDVPCFYIETIAENGDGRIEFSKSYFRGDKTSFLIERQYT